MEFSRSKEGLGITSRLGLEFYNACSRREEVKHIRQFQEQHEEKNSTSCQYRFPC